MDQIKSKRKYWNERQSELQSKLLGFEQHDQAVQLFLSQHAMLHSAGVSRTEQWSYEDEILNDITEEQARRIPHNCDHSVAWCIWHIARIEDVTMNVLVAGDSQILHGDNWLDELGAVTPTTGNAMDEAAVARLSAAIHIDALRAYRFTVGQRTRAIVQALRPEDLKSKVEPSRLQRLMDEGAVVEAARGLIDYWGKRTFAELLLMPPTRHNFIHLNEALRLKRRKH
jgi:hypothetical protein